jgi:CRP-like cAMP-binding protein
MLARDRLERALKHYAGIGVDVEGQIGDADPLLAVEDLLRDEQFDEVIVSTLSRGRSQWLKARLPERVRAVVQVPVTHVTDIPEREATVRAVKQVPLFGDLPNRPLRALSRTAITHEYAPGEVIVKEGSTESDLFVILDGRVSVHKDGRRVASFQAGDFFGEISLIDPGRRTADVVAENPTRCIRIASGDFWGTIENDPSLAIPLLRHLGRRLRKVVQPPAD